MKKLITFLVLGLFLVPSTSLATARSVSQGSTGSSSGNSVANSEEQSNSGSEKSIRNCERIQLRMQNRYDNYGLSKDKHLSVYNNMLERLNNFVDMADTAGIDTTKLKSDIATLESLIDEFKNLAEESFTKMQETKASICDSDEITFRQSLVQSRNQLKETHRKAQAIRVFYHDTIRPDLLAIKEQLHSTEESTTAETETETVAPSSDE